MENVKTLFLLFGISIYSCNAIVNLTWTVKTDKLRLRCTTSSLIWPVKFLSPDGKEVAYCQVPVPSPHCHTSYESYITVYQNTTTNSTILTYKGTSSSLNGQWKCIYGHNVDVDVVNVTIQMKDISMNNQNDENCCEEFYAWTMFGFTLIIVATLLYNSFNHLNEKNGCWKKRTEKGEDHSFCFPKKRNCKYMRIVIIIFVITIVTVFPVYIGSISKDCTYKEVFIIYGFFKAVILLLFLSPLIGRDSR